MVVVTVVGGNVVSFVKKRVDVALTVVGFILLVTVAGSKVLVNFDVIFDVENFVNTFVGSGVRAELVADEEVVQSILDTVEVSTEMEATVAALTVPTVTDTTSRRSRIVNKMKETNGQNIWAIIKEVISVNLC